MAARLDPENIEPMRQCLHHLVAKAPWSDTAVLEQVRDYVLPTMEKQGPIGLFVNLIRPTLMLSFGPPYQPTIFLAPAGAKPCAALLRRVRAERRPVSERSGH